MTTPRSQNPGSTQAPNGTTSFESRRAVRRQQREQQRILLEKGRGGSSSRSSSGAQRQRWVFLAAGAIVLVVVAMVAIRFINSSQAPTITSQPAPPEVVDPLTSVPQATLDAVGRGTASALPTAIRVSSLTGPNGHPLISYAGAEYCPYCAGERWPVVIALSRFGTFSNLQLTASAADDVYPSTHTLSFVNASYTSNLVDFTAVELQSNQRSGSGGYQTLQTPTTLQNQLLTQYDAPPYVAASSQGSIPFIDFGNQYIVSGASYDVGVLQGMTWQQIAASLSDPSSAPAKSILGTANVLTATTCIITNNQPASVCSDSVISQIENTLSSQQSPNGGH